MLHYSLLQWKKKEPKESTVEACNLVTQSLAHELMPSGLANFTPHITHLSIWKRYLSVKTFFFLVLGTAFRVCNPEENPAFELDHQTLNKHTNLEDTGNLA